MRYRNIGISDELNQQDGCEVLFEQFVIGFESAPKELVLDFDCADDRVHGLQEGRHFHGYYDDFCFLPL